MRHTQLVDHELIGMLAVRFAQILVQHYAVTDGQHRVHAIYRQEHDICEVTGLQYQGSQKEYDDEGYAYATHIPGKAFCFVLRAEVKEAEHQHRQYRDAYEAVECKANLHVQVE